MRSGIENSDLISAQTRMHVSAYFSATTKMTVVLHIAGSVQGHRLQHEVACEGTIPATCFYRRPPLCVHRQIRSPPKELLRKICKAFDRQGDPLRYGDY